MSALKHTPGPWKASGRSVQAEGRADTYDGPVWGTILFAEDTHQEDTEGRLWSVSGTAEANAHLIAAAPEMLEALKGAGSMLTDIMEGRAWGAIEEQIDEINAAISKAEGRA